MLVLVPVFPFRADPDDARVLIPADHGPETMQHLKAFIESKYLQRLRESKDSHWHPWTLSEVPSRRDKKGYALRRPAGQYKKKNWVRKIEYVLHIVFGFTDLKKVRVLLKYVSKLVTCRYYQVTNARFR